MRGPGYVCGLAHAAKLALSSLHSNVAVGSLSVNANVALVSKVGLVGCDVRMGAGGTAAAVRTANVVHDFDAPLAATVRAALLPAFFDSTCADSDWVVAFGFGFGFWSPPRFVGACCWKPARASAPCTPPGPTGACVVRS